MSKRKKPQKPQGDMLERALTRSGMITARDPRFSDGASERFRCVCCGRLRATNERREPASEVCIRCVEDAGYQGDE